MEDCRLPADAGLIDCCASIDVGATIEKQSGRRYVAVFRGHMQERSSLKQEETSAGLAAIEFWETLIHEPRIGANQLCQIIELAAQQCQHRRSVISGLATGLEKDIDAGAQPFQGPRIGSDEVVESRARIGSTGGTLPWIPKVRIGAV